MQPDITKDYYKLDRFATKILQTNFLNISTIMNSKVDIIVGSPPCIGFSQGNPQSGPDHWANKNFIKCFERIEELQPKYFLIEMVPRILKIGQGTYYKALSKVKDYSIWDNIFEVSEYGSPVKRERLYLFGSKDYLDFNPLLTLQKKEFIIPCSEILDKKEYEQYNYLIPDGKFMLSRFTKERKLRKGPFNSALQDNRILKPDQPAFTITGMAFTNMKHYKYGTEYIIKKDIDKTSIEKLHRFLAIEEIADLMGFPTDYRYCTESIGKKCKIIASGIDVRFSALLLKHLYNIIKGEIHES